MYIIYTYLYIHVLFMCVPPPPFRAHAKSSREEAPSFPPVADHRRPRPRPKVKSRVSCPWAPAGTSSRSSCVVFGSIWLIWLVCSTFAFCGGKGGFSGFHSASSYTKYFHSKLLMIITTITTSVVIIMMMTMAIIMKRPMSLLPKL